MFTAAVAANLDTVSWTGATGLGGQQTRKHSPAAHAHRRVGSVAALPRPIGQLGGIARPGVAFSSVCKADRLQLSRGRSGRGQLYKAAAGLSHGFNAAGARCAKVSSDSRAPSCSTCQFGLQRSHGCRRMGVVSPSPKASFLGGIPIFRTARRVAPLSSRSRWSPACVTASQSSVEASPEAEEMGLSMESEMPDWVKLGLNGSLDKVDVDALLDLELPQHPKLRRGMLPNGLRYVVLQNAVPPNRFEAHLEMHVGSVDEEDNQQGLAHLIEHVTFLGSRKREKMLGTGSRSNAYTDFHHTVFHMHSPLETSEGKSLLPVALEALFEIGFEPQFLSSRIEKERRAVLSELQMMNTIEYRVDCKLLEQLHSENNLGCRFPIGLEPQIRRWTREELMAFHAKWYHPCNATLFIVGDFADADAVIAMIGDIFSRTPVVSTLDDAYGDDALASNGVVSSSSSSATKQTPMNGSLPSPSSSLPSNTRRGAVATPVASSGPASSMAQTPAAASMGKLDLQSSPLLQRGMAELRPPVMHLWSVDPSGNQSTTNISNSSAAGAATKLAVEEQMRLMSPSAARFTGGGVAKRRPPYIFQHELLQQVSISLFCKVPVKPIRSLRDLRRVVILRVVLSALQFRVNTRYKSSSPSFTSIDLDHSDSGREGCTVSTLTITSDASQWKGAVAVGVQEMRRLKEFGVTRGEFSRYMEALLSDSAQLAAMIDSIPSIDNLDFIMESDALGHTVMDQVQGHEALAMASRTIELEEVNAVAAELLAYVADYGLPDAPVPAAVVACVPASHEVDGVEEPFVITPNEIDVAITEALKQPIEAEAEVEVPDTLIPEEKLAELYKTVKPHFVPMNEAGDLVLTDEATGISQLRLSNGIRVNYKKTLNEVQGGMMRMVAAGGRSLEAEGESGSVSIGSRALSESGAVGHFSREQVELFCVSQLVNCVLEADEEFLCMDFHFSVGDRRLAAAFQVLHLVLMEPVWVEDALERAKQLYASHYRSMPKSLERAAGNRLMQIMFNNDPRVLDPRPDAISALTLPTVRRAIMDHLTQGNLEVNVVGDFEEAELQQCLLTYLGTATIKREGHLHKERPIKLNLDLPPEMRHQRLFLRDSDERACAYLAGYAANRWGYMQDGRDLNVSVSWAPPDATEEQLQAMKLFGIQVEYDAPSRRHKLIKRKNALQASVATSLLSEVINTRLFTSVRDQLGLTYDVSFTMSLFDRLKLGWWVVSVTSTPDKVDKALEASHSVLLGVGAHRISYRELDRARRTLLTRHESDLKDNSYWLGLITHLQADCVERKTVRCIRDLPALYESVSVDDVYEVYNALDMRKDAIYTCVGVAGASNAGAGHAQEIAEASDEFDEEVGPHAAAAPSTPLQSSGRGRSLKTKPTS
eukprot:jgi/Mesvir1/27585/Mv07330-RA.1